MRSRISSLRRRPIKTTFPRFHSAEPSYLSLSQPFSYGCFTSQRAGRTVTVRRVATYVGKLIGLLGTVGVVGAFAALASNERASVRLLHFVWILVVGAAPLTVG